MSVLWKINNSNQLQRLFQSNYQRCALPACYSSRSNSKDADSHYKVVKTKVRRFDDDSKYLGSEGGPNWELFAPKGNRFYLPGSMGPAWQSAATTIQTPTLLSLVDFDSKQSNKLHISSQSCPVLLRRNLHEIFPTPEVVSKDALTLITLDYKAHDKSDVGAKKFVLAAHEICSRLRINGYWADFMNPFSGRPFFSFSNGRRLYKLDQRFRGIDIKLKDQNQCIVISSNEASNTFSGNVFTNAPCNWIVLQSLINTDDESLP